MEDGEYMNEGDGGEEVGEGYGTRLQKEDEERCAQTAKKRVERYVKKKRRGKGSKGRGFGKECGLFRQCTTQNHIIQQPQKDSHSSPERG